MLCSDQSSLRKAFIVMCFYLQSQNNKTPHRRCGVLCFSLVHYEWEECHESCAFDGFGQGTLVLGREAGAAARQDAAVGIQEALEAFDILVVDELDIVGIKVIVFHNCYVI